jgi:hypothetical protein
MHSDRHAITTIRRTRAAMSHKRPTAASAIRAHPRKDYASRIQLVLYRRGPCAPGWEARYRIDNAWSG